MLERLRERLTQAVDAANGRIDMALDAVEQLIQRLEEERTFWCGFCGEKIVTGSEADTLESKLRMLHSVKNDLARQREENSRSLERIQALSKMRSRTNRVGIKGSTTICVIPNEITTVAEQCAALAEQVSETGRATVAKLEAAFCEEPFWEDCGLREAFQGYGRRSEALAVVYAQTSEELRMMHEELEAVEDSISVAFREPKVSTDTGSFPRVTQQQAQSGPVPPPVPQQARPMPAAPPPPAQPTARPMMQHAVDAPLLPSRPQMPEPPMPQASQAGAAPKKKSFLGFFRDRKKEKTQKETVTPPRVDSVQFSAVAPAMAAPGKYVPVQIVMYEDALRQVVDDLVNSRGEKMRESRGGYFDAERNSTVRVILTSPDLLIEDGKEERIWRGKYLNFEFVVKIPEDYRREQILLSAAVYINDVIATKLKMILDCNGAPRRNMQVTREDIASAFVSYASQDRNRVAAIIQGMKKARPDLDIFFDVESLRSGQRWGVALKTEIEKRDVLFLCWSKFARESKWVDMEWRYALERKGEDCIEPIPIDPPEDCPPPVELQEKHFHDRMLYIIRATAPASAESSCPYLMRVNTGERVRLDKPVYRIGKDRQCVDLCISENAAISRSHADIVCRDGRYYIVDNNSTNHTYVNGTRVPADAETLLEEGAKVRLANEEFVFSYTGPDS